MPQIPEKAEAKIHKYQGGIVVREFHNYPLGNITGLLGTDLEKKIYAEYYFTEFGCKYYDAYHEGSYFICPIVVFKNEVPVIVLVCTVKNNCLSWFHFPAKIFSAGSAEIINECHATFFNFLDIFWKENKIQSVLLDTDSFFVSRYFSAFQSVQTKHFGIIDLSLPEEIIKSGLRKSYKSLVNWGIKNLEIKLFEKDNINENEFTEFKNFHFKVAGRKTRSEKSWMIQLEAIKKGAAFLTCAFINHEMVAATFIQNGSEEAFYAVGVYDRERMSNGEAIAHFPLLHSIFHAKKMGLKFFNVDELDISPSKTGKQNDISFFKKGFVSQTRTVNHYSFLLL